MVLDLWAEYAKTCSCRIALRAGGNSPSVAQSSFCSSVRAAMPGQCPDKEKNVFKRKPTFRSSGKRSSGLSVVALLLILGVAGAGAWFLMRDLRGPEVSVSPSASRVGLSQPLEVSVSDKSGVQSVTVSVKRGSQSMVVKQETYAVLEKSRTVSFDLKDTRLPEGSFELEVRAFDGSYAGFGKGNSTTFSKPMVLDSKPPRIAVKTVPPSVHRGGSALIVYTLSEEVVKTGVRVGDFFFPGYRQENGGYACLFAFPVTMRADAYHPEIMAQDKAGNITSSRLLVRAMNKNYRADTLNIPESFLNYKANELAQLCPDKDTPLEQYLCANSKVRAANDAKLIELAADPGNVTPRFVWEGPFRRLPRSAVKASFGDHRTYVDGHRSKIDEQTHMGIDLASVAQAPIPASAAGRVIWADYLGIHGHMVLIDHGLGLMTQYSHLTDYKVNVGDVVKAGDIVGTTGVSGLAGGDHLHFGVLVGGVPVQPLEWLDSSWVKNNITSRLNTNVK